MEAIATASSTIWRMADISAKNIVWIGVSVTEVAVIAMEVAIIVAIPTVRFTSTKVVSLALETIVLAIPKRIAAISVIALTTPMSSLTVTIPTTPSHIATRILAVSAIATSEAAACALAVVPSVAIAESLITTTQVPLSIPIVRTTVPGVTVLRVVAHFDLQLKRSKSNARNFHV